MTSQQFESYVPVYDTVPEKWEDAREFLVEHLKKISNAVNAREIGFFIDEEVLSGKQFIPIPAMAGVNSANSQQFRTVLRKVINYGPLAIGVNPGVNHGITFDANFTLVQLYAAATNSGTLIAEPIPNGGSTITMNAAQVIITSTAVFDRCFCVIEYIQEI